MKFRSITSKFPLLFRVGLAFLSLIIVWMIYLDVKVQKKFEGKRWQLPAKVYAQPLELYEGVNITQKELVSELKLLNYQESRSIDRAGTYFTRGKTVHIHTLGFKFWDGEEAPKKVSVRFNRHEVLHLSAQGNPLDIVRLEPYQLGGIYGDDREDRQLVQLADVPPRFVKTLLAVEDRQFYDHIGLSFKGIARAFLKNMQEGALVQGGSTLTQQLVKNFYLSNERTLSRKLMEAVMALLLEFHYSKDEILETYLNEVYLGQKGSWAIHGVGLASYYYFGRPISSLQPEQQALLVAIIKGPSYYNPFRKPKRALSRRNQVLSMMAEWSLVEKHQLDQLKSRPLGLVKGGYAINRFPGFLELVKEQLSDAYAPEDLESEGLRIFTTLSPRVQLAAEAALSKEIAALEAKGKVEKDQLQGSFLVTSPSNGEVLALVAGRDPKAQGFNRALNARRQVGSIIKPVVFMAALEDRTRYQLTTLIPDKQFEYPLPNGDIWKPNNFDRQSHGEVMLLEALVHSYNQATAQLAMTIGIDRVTDLLLRMGINRSLPEVPALSLGAVELSSIEVAQIYQTIAANGFSSPINTIREILDLNGQPLKRYPLEVKQVVDQVAANLIQFALQEVMDRGTGASAYDRLPSALRLAGKTGTTNDSRDSWFAGMSEDYLAIAWLGRDDNGPTLLTGGSGALKVWTTFMAQVNPSPYNPVQASEVALGWAHPNTGQLTTKKCRDSVRVAFDSDVALSRSSSCIGATWNRWIKGL